MIKTKTYRNQLDTYEVVHELPANAMLVSEYCKKESIWASNFYRNLRNGKSAVRVVVFHGVNWVVQEKK